MKITKELTNEDMMMSSSIIKGEVTKDRHGFSGGDTIYICLNQYDDSIETLINKLKLLTKI